MQSYLSPSTAPAPHRPLRQIITYSWHLQVIDSKGTLLVSSQTQPNTVYAVDLGRPSCTCHSFETEGISYCKHVAAAHYTFPHFKRAARRINPIAPESFEPPSWSPSIDPAPPYSPAIQQQDPPQQPEQPPGTSKHALWEPVRKQLQMLASQEHPDLSRATIDDIERFKELLGVFYAVPRPQKRSNMAILGPALRLPPNQNTATETARAMGKRKSKPKTRYSGPYDAGERPGKFVKGQHIPPPLQHVPPPASHPNVLYSTQSYVTYVSILHRVLIYLQELRFYHPTLPLQFPPFNMPHDLTHSLRTSYLTSIAVKCPQACRLTYETMDLPIPNPHMAPVPFLLPNPPLSHPTRLIASVGPCYALVIAPLCHLSLPSSKRSSPCLGPFITLLSVRLNSFLCNYDLEACFHVEFNKVMRPTYICAIISKVLQGEETDSPQPAL